MKLFQISILIILFYSGTAFGQDLSVFEIQCKNIKKIDSLEFEQNKTAFAKISKSKSIYKVKEKLTIKTKDSTIVFKDNLSDDAFFEYSYLGEFQKSKWTLILGQDYNQNYYYLIDMESSKVDTLVGFPQIFKNEILSIESSYTDGYSMIEIWKMNKDQMIKAKSFSVKKCMIYGIQEAYLKEEYLYLRNSYSSITDDFYRIKIK